MRRRAVLVAALLLAGPAWGRVLTVGPGLAYAMPGAAAQDAREGDTIRIAPGNYGCAVLTADRLVVEGTGDPADVVLAGPACGGKGMLVTRGNGITVRNLTLAGARVPDGNGAGIRNEAADLLVDGVRFVDNQNGILSTPQVPGTLVVRRSRFERNGGCGNAGGCAHGIYAGRNRLLRVEGSVFVGTREGHHVKSRGARTEILGCVIEDGPEGTASYLVEQPDGGALVVRDNVMEKGGRSGNRGAAIMIGAEGATEPTPEITVENNVFRNSGDYRTSFVSNRTATPALLRGNRLAGRVTPLLGAGRVVD